MVPNRKNSKNIIEYLETSFEDFTTTQKKLADYILSNYHEVLFFTADELASKINTTSSSVVRFAKGIGYSGYPDLQKDLRKLIIDKININGQSVKAKQYTPSNKNNIIDMSLKKDFDNLNKLLEIKDDKKIEEFVNVILKSKKKYIIALRTSFSLGHFLYFKMRKIVPNVFLFNNYDQGIYDIIQDLNSEDVVIAISFPRFTNLTINIAKYAKNKGIKLVSITDSRISPLYKISNVCLLCPYKGFTFFNSNVAAMALINSIINRIFNFHYNSGTKHLKKEDSVLLDFNVWYKEKGYFKDE